MKILLFRKGRIGETVSIPGNRPEEEIETALGGAMSMKPIRAGLVLVKLMDGERIGLRRNYCVRRPWVETEYVHGDCIVTAIDAEGRYIDITEGDVRTAECAVIPMVLAP